MQEKNTEMNRLKVLMLVIFAALFVGCENNPENEDELFSIKHAKTLEGHTEWVYSVSWSPDGKKLASGSWDNTVIIWDANTGAKLKTLEGHRWYVISVCWSPDGKYVASCSEDKTVIIWDANTGEQVRTLERGDNRVLSV